MTSPTLPEGFPDPDYVALIDWKARALAAEAAVAALEAAIELDRTKIIDGVNGISDALRRRQWLLTSRGSYEWDDNRFLAEFRDAINEIDKAVEPLRAIGIDKTNCPQTTAEVVKARTEVSAAVERAEKAVEILAWIENVDPQLVEEAEKHFGFSLTEWEKRNG
jgi:phosphate-selective porin